MTFLLVYLTECLLELVGVVLRKFQKKIKFCVLCALKQVFGQFHDISVKSSKNISYHWVESIAKLCLRMEE